MDATDRTLIRPQRGWVGVNLKELWRYRELIGFIIWRDITVRYKQTLLGIAWVVIQPFVSMVVLTVIFGRLIKVPTDGLPYPIFSYSALVIWTYFADTLRRSSQSLLMNYNLVTKIFFPRIIMPLAGTLSGLIDFVLAFVVLIGMFFYYGVPLRAQIVYAPAFLMLAMLLAFGVGTWLAALNVQFRDVNYIVPFLVQIWMFASPVAYSMRLVPLRWRTWYCLNPMAGVIQGFRWTLLGGDKPSIAALLLSTGMIALIATVGVAYFRRMEKDFADVI